MSNAIALPDDALARYLEQHVDGFRGPMASTKFKGGQSNPTYRLDAESGRYVLRRKPPGMLLASAHAVDREFRVISALRGSAVPVARALHLCTDESVIGSMFYVMEFVDGPIHWDPSLPDVHADKRAAHFDAMVDALIALAKVDVGAAGLSDFGKSGNYFARQVARWTEQFRAAETDRIDAMEHLIAWLPQHLPGDDARAALVHGDFRIDNLIWHRDDARIAAIVDWELSTLGSPFADIAYLCMALRLPRNGVLPGLAGLDRDALGIPSEHAIVDRFAAGSGHDPRPHWNFLLAFQFFRLAAIAQGVLKRALQGNASSERAQQAGAMAATIAQLGSEQAR